MVGGNRPGSTQKWKLGYIQSISSDLANERPLIGTAIAPLFTVSSASLRHSRKTRENPHIAVWKYFTITLEFALSVSLACSKFGSIGPCPTSDLARFQSDMHWSGLATSGAWATVRTA